MKLNYKVKILLLKKNYGYIQKYRETLKQFISSPRYLIYTILKNNKNKFIKKTKII